MKRIGWLAVFLAVITLASGCKSGTNQNSTHMRALHAVVDAEALDILVDDSVTTAALAFGSTSSYSEFSSGSRDVKARSAVNGAILTEKTQAFASGVDYTLVFYGKRGAIGTLLLTDDTTDPSSGKFKVRLAGLSPDAGAVDLYVVADDIAAAPATISSVGYATVTDYAEVTAGSYRIVFAAAGTKEILFQSATQSVAAGAKLTVAVFPAAAGKLVNAVLLTSASGTFLANPLARVKAINAVPDSSTLNFKADGTTLLSNVPFTASSSYVTTAAGAHTLQLEAANVPGSTLATLARELDPARDYSAVAANTLDNVELVIFSDDNSLPAAGFAKLRFANARVDPAPVDVLVNFASQTSSLGPKGASTYYPLAAGTSYSITFATAGGISVIASLESVELDAGGVYTAYLFGTATTPVARLVRDR